MISFICSATHLSSYPESSGEVVFVGKSNVGKSSLINALYGKVAYVGKTPGKTRLLNFFNVDNKYTVCDVPGYGYANRSEKEIIAFGEMMEEYFSKREALKLCVMILDIRRTPNEDDLDMYNYLNKNNIPVLFVLNKCDKLSNNQRINQEKLIYKTLGIGSAICISTLKHVNIEHVALEIKSFIERDV